ncbi:MAG TPA: sulfotransferase [Burkholderiaceae bacterium]|nr:sulfotransferase [Burkholderiaceae bacterium]
MDKRIYFLAGLPRSGSTLLANILAQNPQIYVTPTSGIVDMLVQVRNSWDRNDAFQAADRKLSEQIKERVLRAMLQAYFAHVKQPICIDKNRYWAEFLEMGATLVGGREKVKVIVTVRDLRDVLASFERLYRKTSALGQIHQEANLALKFKTALGRVETFIDDGQPVGRAYNAIRDAVTRGWKDRMHFVDYDDLTRHPKETLAGVYRFLGEEPCEHDFDRVEQVTFEDDFVYGFKDLHQIRMQVKPQEPQWSQVFDDAVFQTPVWKNVENAATFWKLYKARKPT